MVMGIYLLSAYLEKKIRYAGSGRQWGSGYEGG